MENFKEIAEKCLAGELSGTFVFQNGQKISSDKLRKYGKDTPYGDYPYYIRHICTLTNYGFGYNSDYNVVDFIPDKMIQKKIEIDIPEGKVPVMEQTEKGVVITWKEKELTYDEIYAHLHKNKVAINYYVTKGVVNNENESFLNKTNILRKLTNIRNYFGKPDNMLVGWCIFKHSLSHKLYAEKEYCTSPFKVVFAKKEHAEQAIKMLGDELKYLFEPW